MSNQPLNPFTAPQAPTHVEGPVPSPTAATKGQRIAGGLLIVNAALVLIELAVMGGEGDATVPGVPSSPGRALLPAAIDIAIGISLLAGNRKLVVWAILRAALGTLLYTALRLKSDPITAVFTVLVGAALLLLLIGDAGRTRIALGASAFGFYALLEMVGITGAITGTNYLGGLIMTASGEVEPGTAGRVQGVAYPYTIQAPGDAWRLRTAEAAKKDNPLADRWLVRPDKDAHVLIIAEHEPGSPLLIEPYADAVLGNIKQVSTRFEELGREPVRGHEEHGRLLHTRGVVDGMDIEYYHGVFTAGDRGFQVLAFASREAFPSVRGELLQIIESFSLPAEAWKPILPKDVEEAPAGQVTGLSYGYTVQAPGAWHLRKAEFVKKDNELVDQWLVRPDKDAHVLIIAEHAPGAVLPIDGYADEVLKGAKANSTSFTLDTREPLKTYPKSGLLLRVRATINGMDLVYRYGLVTAGERGFQIIGFAQSNTFPSVEGEIMKIIESFSLPPARP